MEVPPSVLRDSCSRRRTALACALGAVFAACGGGGGGGGSVPPVVLTAVEVGPSAVSLPLGLTQQMAATGTWSDGSRTDLTASADWSSSDDAIATVGLAPGNAGLVTTVTEGAVRIRAEHAGILGDVALQVAPAALTRIDVLPDAVELPSEVTVQLSARGSYTDGSTRDVTAAVAWRSLDPAVATVSGAPGSEGLATSLAPGVARIEAEASSLSGSAQLMVHPIHELEADVDQVPSSAVTALAADGTALAAWCHQFAAEPGVIHWSHYDPISGWAPKQALDTSSVGDRTLALALACSDSGDALLVWTGHVGLYASSYAPGVGWSSIDVLASGPNPFLEFAEGLQLAMDAAGNGLLVWRLANGPIKSTRYVPGTGWLPSETVGSPAMAAQMGNLDMTSDGRALFLWQHWNLGDWTLYASEFTPAGGWAPRVVLDTTPVYHYPVVDLAEDGTALAVWLDQRPPVRLRCAWRPAGSTWQAAATLSHQVATGWPSVALDDEFGDALVCWVGVNSQGYTAAANLFLNPAGWQGEEVLKQYDINQPGLLRPYLSGGEAVAFWLHFGAVTWLERRPLHAASGWGAVESLRFMAYGNGAASSIRNQFHSGTGASFVTWVYSHDDVDDVVIHGSPVH